MVSRAFLSTIFRNPLSGRYSVKDMSFFEGSVKMSCLRISIAMGLLVSLSGTCFASPGVIALRGAIVERRLARFRRRLKGFAFHGCPARAAGQDGSTRRCRRAAVSALNRRFDRPGQADPRKQGRGRLAPSAVQWDDGRALTSGSTSVT